MFLLYFGSIKCRLGDLMRLLHGNVSVKTLRLKADKGKNTD